MKKMISILIATMLLSNSASLSVFAEAGKEGNPSFAIPESYSETASFLNTYGNIYVQDDMICFCGKFNAFPGIVNRFDSENSTADFDVLSDEAYTYMDDGWYHNVMVFQVKSAGTLEFTWTEDTSAMQNASAGTYVSEVYHFTFSVDEQLQVTETDIFSFVPDGYDEAMEFEKENGSVSIQNGYIIYCRECDPSGGYSVYLDADENSSAYDIISENYLSKEYEEEWPLPGSLNYYVQVLKPTDIGYLKIAWTQRQDWEKEPIDSTSKTFLVFPTVSDIEDITDEGLVTRVRVVDYYTGENIPDVTLGLYCQTFSDLECDVVWPPMLTWNTSDEPEYSIDYPDSNLLFEDPYISYIDIISMPENYNIMADKHIWPLYRQDEILIELATDEEIKTNFTLGDVNRDGQFTIADAVTLQKWLLGSGTLQQWRAADFNKDNLINGFDLCLMKTALLETLIEIDINSLTEEEILNLTDDQMISIYDMVLEGKLNDTINCYPLPDDIDPNDMIVNYHYRSDGDLLRASAETDEEAEAFAEGFFVPNNDSYTFDGCEKVYSDDNLWIYRSYYNNHNVKNKPYYVVIYNKSFYDAATKTVYFEPNEQNLLEFISIYSYSNYNKDKLNAFYTETEDKAVINFYRAIPCFGDWGLNDTIQIWKNCFTVDKTTGAFSTSEIIVKGAEIPGTAKDIEWDYSIVDEDSIA